MVDGLEKEAFDWVEAPCTAKMSQIVSEYEKQHDALTKRLKAIPTSKWETKIPLLFDGQEMMRETGYDMAWGFLLDQIHHRGQLSTYLRTVGAKVPAIYGPSADEQS